MAKLGINTGVSPNDNSGDSLIVGAIKINSNFNEIYTYLGAGSTTILSSPIWSKSNAGISTLQNVGIGTTNPTSTLTVSGNAIFTGVVTATSFIGTISNSNYANSAGIATYSSTSGISTLSTKVSIAETTTGTNSILLSTGTALGDNTLYIDSGLTYNATTNTISASAFNGPANYATNAGIATVAQGLDGTPNISVGIITATNVIIGAATTQLVVNGNTRITGILTVGSSSITLNGPGNTLNVGTGVSIYGNTGIVSSTDLYTHGLKVSGTIIYQDSILYNTWQKTNSGIHTLSNVGIGTTNPTNDLTVAGSGTSTSQIYVSGISTFSGNINVGSGGTIITTSGGLVGINSSFPSKTLDVIGDVRVGIGTSQGVILTAPNGTQYRLIVDNSGSLSTVAV